ncbi:signal peptide peptidase-like 4 isoform X1 [Jatropha curcas]|uniref:signal peptide peptidase-like 4 isoform X1 n=1 Tax=Jatropha curcas TaxID=180498 RepID=UPI001894EBEF|nr:signal peptide peptidase-like 4 isoform X1 [Jatropha curcas]
MGIYGALNIFLAVLAISPCFSSAGDIVHQDDVAPKRPGCDNNFVLVKVPTSVDGVENIEYVGVGARFGRSLESKEKNANKTRLVLADPPDLCRPPKKKLQRDVILVHRGNCSFTTKSNIAEEANASAILIINYRTGIFVIFITHSLFTYFFTYSQCPASQMKLNLRNFIYIAKCYHAQDFFGI